MSIEKTIVCLANSYMGKYRCVAGKELGNDKPEKWVRLTTHEREGVLKKDVRELEVLDIIDVKLLNSHPADHQQENWLLDMSSPFKKDGKMPRSALTQLIDSTGQLWINGYKTKYGMNDYIPYSLIKKMKVNDSLRFIQVEELTLSAHGWKVLGHFRHDNEEYSLKVTDPDYRTYRSKGFSKNKKIYECFLTVSLAGCYKKTKACHKLIATIIS